MSVETNLVSIIIPIYNVEKTLEKCLNSVLNQSYRNIEIILVDDGSSDSSLSICNIYKNREKRVSVYHQENRGVASARNLGLDKATGDFICFVDPDDWIERTMIRGMLKEMLLNNADVAVCGYQHLCGDIRHTTEECKLNYEVVTKKELILNGFISFWGPAVWNKMFSIKVLSKVRFPDLVVGEDMVFCTEVFFKAKKVISLPEVYYHYITNENSVTVAAFNKRRVLDSIEGRKFLLKKVEKISEKLKIIAYRECMRGYYYAIQSYAHVYNSSGKNTYHQIVEEWERFKLSDKEKKCIDTNFMKKIDNIVKYMYIYKMKNYILNICKVIIKKASRN